METTNGLIHESWKGDHAYDTAIITVSFKSEDQRGLVSRYSTLKNIPEHIKYIKSCIKTLPLGDVAASLQSYCACGRKGIRGKEVKTQEMVRDYGFNAEGRSQITGSTLRISIVKVALP